MIDVMLIVIVVTPVALMEAMALSAGILIVRRVFLFMRSATKNETGTGTFAAGDEAGWGGGSVQGIGAAMVRHVCVTGSVDSSGERTQGE